jgi:hypothetical protein
MTRKEAFEILGLDANASLNDARMAYLELKETYHPRKIFSPDDIAVFWIISDAWKVVQKTSGKKHIEVDDSQNQEKIKVNTERIREKIQVRRKHIGKKPHQAQSQVSAKLKERQPFFSLNIKHLSDDEQIHAWRVEEKIRFRSWIAWFFISLLPIWTIMIGNRLKISGFYGSAEDYAINRNLIKTLLGEQIFTGSEPIGANLFIGSVLVSLIVAATLGTITGLVIIKIRKWYKMNKIADTF